MIIFSYDSKKLAIQLKLDKICYSTPGKPTVQFLLQCTWQYTWQNLLQYTWQAYNLLQYTWQHRTVWHDTAVEKQCSRDGIHNNL